MATPSALVLECEECGDVPHRVLAGKVSGRGGYVFQGTVKCTNCGRVRSATVRESKAVSLPVIVSDGADSVRKILEFSPEETVRVGARLDAADHSLLVTAIEQGDRRVPEARARDVHTVWAKTFDRVRVRFSVARGKRTAILHVEAAPDEEFLVGDIVNVGREHVFIQHIRTQAGTLRRGAALAADIETAFGRAVRERTAR